MIESTAENFDAAGYETLETISRAKEFNRWMYQTIKPFLKGSILELGSGIGNISDYIIKDFSNVTLSDFNFYYKEHLEKKYHNNKNVKEIITLDLQNNYFDKQNSATNTFDSIVLLNVIEHLANDALAIQLCNFLLKKNGNLIVLAPAYNFLYSQLDKILGHYRRYTIKSLSRQFSNHPFEIIHKQYFNLLGIGGWLIYNKILKKERIDNSKMKIFNGLVSFAKPLDKVVFNKVGLSVIIVAKKK